MLNDHCVPLKVDANREPRLAQALRIQAYPTMILAGNGSDELLAMIFRATLGPRDTVAYPVPTYSLYDTLATIQEARVLRFPVAKDFSIPLGQLAKQYTLDGHRLDPVAAGDNAMRAGAAIYKDSCAACHRDAGTGEVHLFPRLAGSALVQSEDPTTLVRVVLQGTRAVSTSSAP